jgi:hypothetical protein
LGEMCRRDNTGIRKGSRHVMFERTKIYISTRVISPPSSGGALQITARLANRLSTLKNVDCTIGVSNKNKTHFAQLLHDGVKCTCFDGASDLEIAKQEEDFFKDLSAEWSEGSGINS